MDRFRLSAPLMGLMLAAAPCAAEPFELKDGDRVVLVGATMIEQEQRYGYWEAALTSRWPDRNVTFRNLGWSGDDVWGDARASFGTRADGFNALKDHVLALKPTVIILGYGGNEAFEGAAGLPMFVDGLNVLLDALAPTKARMVLLAPLRQENLGAPLPDPAEHNKDLTLYTDALREAAKKRGLTFADMNDYPPNGPSAPDATDDGLHLTAYGYWRSAYSLESALGLPRRESPAEIDAAKAGHFTLTAPRLPVAPPPGREYPVRWVPEGLRLKVKGLAPGLYALTADGRPVAAASADQWDGGVVVERGPDSDQAEKLRQTIVAKNRLYFYRWRPANETYLFGFRKAEQGKNAIEIPQFDPLVVEKEEEIAKLRVPVAHTYELKPEAK